MSDFMQQQIEYGLFVRVESHQCTYYLHPVVIPSTVDDWCEAVRDNMHEADELPATVACDVLDYLSDTFDANHILEVEYAPGYGARLSAPGYLDCTDWCVFDTEQEARDYLDDMYGDE